MALVKNIEQCLEAIRKYSPKHQTVSDAECWASDVGKELWVYVNDPPRDEVVENGIYYTFVVRIDPTTEKVLRVTHYRSKKGAKGDSTLPP
jgi:hypothetical protein